MKASMSGSTSRKIDSPVHSARRFACGDDGRRHRVELARPARFRDGLIGGSS
jgi:hypothetical protein